MSYKNPWKKLASRVVYENKWMRLIEDKVINPSGNKGIYAYIDKLPGLVMIPMTDKKEIFMVGQWRYVVNKYSWELPAGMAEKGESDLEAAKRELLEEVNLKAKKWEKIGFFYYLTGTGNQVGPVYLAQDLHEAEGNSDDEEDIKIKKMTMSQIEKMIKENKIFDGPTIAAFYKLKLYLKL